MIQSKNHVKTNFNNTAIMILSLLVSLVALGTIIYTFKQVPKIAYIKTEQLLNSYKGMQEAKLKFEEKAKMWQANADTLKMEFESSLKEYEKIVSSLKPAAKIQKEIELRKQQEDYSRYSQALNKQAETEDKKLTEGVLAQVNAYLKVYGEKHGYDVVFGAANGNVVHGKDAYDITDEVLVELNSSYEGR